MKKEDRRVKKTEKALAEALSKLLNEKGSVGTLPLNKNPIK